MLAIVSIKGQVTVFKAIRHHPKIEQGTQLDVKLNNDGLISVRSLDRSALSIVGLLKRPGHAAGSTGQMTEAVAGAAVDRLQRSRKAK